MNKVISKEYVDKNYIPRALVEDIIQLIEKDLTPCKYAYQREVTQKHLRIIRGKLKHYDKELEYVKGDNRQ